ncbi:transposase [Flavobacterium lipolyticum]|uniref:Transposase n=1 Tax=Flavobacterium lipolyticum TaxID=2893754 RepID=A0ABS8LZB1_9FLAO|nr:transposase [Flavobacterium sp. F-126]MCC9017922.1 transposase [Flavobacterium sp. F-126]
MERKIKYNYEFKLRCVNEVLNRHRSVNSVANENNFSGQSPSTDKSVGTDTTLNKFRLQVDRKGNYYFRDADNNIPYNKNEAVKSDNMDGKYSRHILTEVRDTN